MNVDETLIKPKKIVSVAKDTHARLKKLAAIDEMYIDEVINKALDAYEKAKKEA